MSDNRKLSNDINECGYNTLSAIINYNYSVKIIMILSICFQC